MPARDRRRDGRARGSRGARPKRSRRPARGEGPTLLECKTYRFTGHSRSDARGYRTREEEAEWAERDPLVVLGARCSTTPTLEQLEDEVEAELDDAVEFARTSPFPDPAEAFEDVYA